jgi:hypothetical protein
MKITPSSWALSALLSIVLFASWSCSPPDKTAQAHPAPGPANLQTMDPDDVEVSAPVSHGNLAIYFLTALDFADTRDLLTLDEALEKKIIRVHETGDVNELTVENLSPTLAVFLQAGDIVKGGRQDRAIGTDFLLRPRAGRFPIQAFCVEQGRWSNRGQESPAEFSSSKNTVAAKDLKIALRQEKSQGGVWNQVHTAQAKLQSRVGAGVQAAASPTSLQLSLENRDVKKLTQAYLAALRPRLAEHPHALGFVCTINGQINSAELYASHDLLRRFWEKAVEAAVIEAIGEQKDTPSPAPPLASRIRDDLRQAGKQPKTEALIYEDLWSITAEGPASLVFQTVEKSKGSAWLRRNYLWK